jgi:hypothetical protein
VSAGERVEVCAYCGTEAPTTRDHIPPKGIFPDPRPADLITVASCARCNHGASADDDRFRAYLSLHVGTDTVTTQRLWERAIRGIRRNRQLHSRLLQEMEPTWLTTPSGVIQGRGVLGRWDSDAHDKTVERMIRGLYFRHYGEVLGTRAPASRLIGSKD